MDTQAIVRELERVGTGIVLIVAVSTIFILVALHRIENTLRNKHEGGSDHE